MTGKASDIITGRFPCTDEFKAHAEKGDLFEIRDTHFANFLLRLIDRNGAEEPTLKRIFSHLSRASATGHICLILDSEESIENESTRFDGAIRLSQADRLRLIGSGLVTVDPEISSPPTPLVLKSNRLYFQNFYHFETNIVHRLRKSAGNFWSTTPEPLNSQLAKFFPSDQDFDQREAARLGLTDKFAIITGGPGTGKTTTVVKILALHLLANLELRIALAAPTGKAALRLQESIAGAGERLLSAGLIDEGLFRRIPTGVNTIHRLLKSRPNRPGFVHNRENPLMVDLMVIDEASMIDLPLLSRLLDALPENAALILIGDHFQLSSVEAGSVLGDLSQSALKDSNSAIHSNIAELTNSRRFGSESGIGIISKSIRGIAYGGADPAELIAILKRGLKNVAFITTDFEKNFTRVIGDGFGSFFDAEDPAEMLNALIRFRVLSPHRRGRYGVDRINRTIIDHFQSTNKIHRRNGYDFFHGQAIQIRVNDYGFRLFNGDTGVIVRDGRSETLKACFHDFESISHGSLRNFYPAILPAHEPCYAITVHKSQGSEFDHVALILPDEASPIMTAELIYTAVTRARNRFTLFAGEEVLKESVRRMIRRGSGIIEELRNS